MLHAPTLAAIIAKDVRRWRILGAVRDLKLPDCWIGAGFIRNAAWDYLHGRCATPPSGDIDVLWFNPEHSNEAEDRRLEAMLLRREPGLAWSVKNQARMHTRNDDERYASTIDAMRYWPETATAVAARRTEDDRCEIAAPFGLEDLFELKLAPTRRFYGKKRHVFDNRIASKGWLESWPKLTIGASPPAKK